MYVTQQIHRNFLTSHDIGKEFSLQCGLKNILKKDFKEVKLKKEQG